MLASPMSTPATFSIRRWLNRRWDGVRTYTPTKLRRDTVAGLSVAVIAIPQSIAYALVAGVPPQYGLYTLVIHALLGSLLNASRFVSVGPINMQSLLTASVATQAISQFADLSPDQHAALYVQLVLGLSLVKGVIQIAAAAAHLGGLARYVSQSVLVGFTAGAGILIAVGQLPSFLGVDLAGVSRLYPGIPGTVQQMSTAMAEGATIDWRSIALGGATIAFVVVMRRVSKMFPAPLLSVFVCGAAVWLMGWTTAPEGGHAILTISELPSGLPHIGLADLTWRQWEALLGGGLALATLGLLEVHAVENAIAEATGDRVRTNDEVAAQGVIHVIAAFFSCMPGANSFGRSALNVYAGAATRFAGAINGLAVAIVILLLAPLAHFVPLACLGAILIVIGFALIDWRFFRAAVRADRSDALVCGVTLIATLVLPLTYAMFIGVFLNIGLYLRQAGRLQLAEMVPTPEGPFREQPLDQHDAARKIVLLQLEGDLFFAIADDLHEALSRLMAHEPRAVIFRLKRTHYVDCTVMRSLEHFVNEMHARKAHVILCGVRVDLVDKFREFGLVDLIGADNVFETTDGIFASANHAMQRARELVGAEIVVK
ncbi:MAG: STAS domain-containing protein [Phycisphaera sp.]|nr:STAS domain-containing protein [Phycisphaera sp.]